MLPCMYVIILAYRYITIHIFWCARVYLQSQLVRGKRLPQWYVCTVLRTLAKQKQQSESTSSYQCAARCKNEEANFEDVRNPLRMCLQGCLTKQLVCSFITEITLHQEHGLPVTSPPSNADINNILKKWKWCQHLWEAPTCTAGPSPMITLPSELHSPTLDWSGHKLKSPARKVLGRTWSHLKTWSQIWSLLNLVKCVQCVQCCTRGIWSSRGGRSSKACSKSSGEASEVRERELSKHLLCCLGKLYTLKAELSMKLSLFFLIFFYLDSFSSFFFIFLLTFLCYVFQLLTKQRHLCWIQLREPGNSAWDSTMFVPCQIQKTSQTFC